VLKYQKKLWYFWPQVQLWSLWNLAGKPIPAKFPAQFCRLDRCGWLK